MRSSAAHARLAEPAKELLAAFPPAKEFCPLHPSTDHAVQRTQGAEAGLSEHWRT